MKWFPYQVDPLPISAMPGLANRGAIPTNCSSRKNRCQHCAAETYVDDTELILSMDHAHLNMITKEMQSIAQFWEQLLYTTERALALEKCFFVPISK